MNWNGLFFENYDVMFNYNFIYLFTTDQLNAGGGSSFRYTVSVILWRNGIKFEWETEMTA